jgi:type II secretory pathway pseudopilin PulG
VRARSTSQAGAPRSREAGFTIVEMVVAALILSVGALTTFGLLSAATKNTQRAKATQVALNRAQQELEAMRSLPNDQLAMTAAPAHVSNQLSPNYRVSNGTFALIRQPPSDYANMIVDGGSLYGGGFVAGGIVTPGPTPFTSGDVSGDIYRYVVWRDDTSCPAATCPGTQDYKQIVVAVKLDTPGNQSGERGYVEVASDFIDPTDSALDDPIPGANGVETAQQFFLSDTPCADGGATMRQDIAGDHLLHNTLGTCASGPQTGTRKGAPDALLLGSPPDPAPADPADPPSYDYSSDTYLEPRVGTDEGVQIRRDDTTTCHYLPTGTTNPESQVHRWVTDPMAANFTMTQKVTIEFYTQTLTNGSYSGALCIYLFRRHETGVSPNIVATDTQLTDTSRGLPYWIYTPPGNGLWPSGAWGMVRKTMTFSGAPYTISAGDRLGVALSLERSGTSGDAVQIMYDHPRYPTRIEVDTNTPIDGG